jgi:hypothetical protein
MTAALAPTAGDEAREVFLGIRIKLPTGKEFVARKPLLFDDCLRWMELVEQYLTGDLPYTKSLKLIIQDLPKVDPEDLSVLQGLTPGEFLDFVVYSFFSHRRWRPGWIQQLMDEALATAAKNPPASSAPSP